MFKLKELLADHFTVYVKKNEKIMGAGLKQLGNGQGMYPVELNESQLEFIHLLFPEIEKALEVGNTLQIYQEGDTYNLIMGRTTQGQPYGEGEYLEVIIESSSPVFVKAFYQMNEKLSNQDKNREPKILKRMQRPYGQDKYTEE